MVSMRMMEVAVDEIVHMISMGHGRMPAILAMDVLRIVPGCMLRGATGWIRRGDGQGMFYHGTVGVLVVQMAIVEIVDVVAVLDARVTTVGAVLMRMGLMRLRHGDAPGVRDGLQKYR